MKIICLKENLKQNLNIAQNIVDKNLTLPILNNLLLATEGGRLKISSTNLEIGINTWTSGKVEKEGAITVPAKILNSFISSLPNKKIELEAKNNILNVKCESFGAAIKCLPADDFPIIPQIKDELLTEIDGELLRTSLEKVVGMAASSELRPEITGILFEFGKDSLCLVATDSFRLAEKKITGTPHQGAVVRAVIIPQRTAQELIRILSEKKTDLKMVLGSNQIMFDAGDVHLISRVIDGQYPDYQQIIPKAFTTEAIIDRDELVNTVRVASIFSSKINDVRFSFKGDKLEILSNDPDVGENRAVLAAEIKGKDAEVNFNYRYLLDGLAHISDKKVTIGLTGETTPAVARAQNNADGYTYVVMPIKGT